MGLLQVLLARYVANGGPLLVCFFVFGSWMNAQIFMLLALSGDRCAGKRWFTMLTIVSFGTLTLAYLWLFALQF
jgi:hypothetical protein